MRRIIFGAALAATCALSACGGTDPGGGSGTLFVSCESDGRPDSTRVRCEVKLRGNPVIGANVVVENVETGISMNLEGVGNGGEYRYEGTINRYARTLNLIVTSGDDDLHARLVGPAPHVITRPPNDAIVRRAEFDFLSVRWDTETAADAATVTTDGAQPIELANDPGEAEVPLGGLSNGAHTLEVTRETSVDLAGGVEGSIIRARYKVDNRFTLEG